VIPLSRANRPRYVIPWVLYSIAAHIFLIGMPAGIFGAAFDASARRLGGL